MQKSKSQIEQKFVIVSCCQSTSDQYSISRIVWNVILFFHVTARIINSPFFPLYSCSLGINSKTCGYRNVPIRIFTIFLRILNTEVTNSQSMIGARAPPRRICLTIRPIVRQMRTSWDTRYSIASLDVSLGVTTRI